MKPSIPKGTRDFSPQEMVKRNYIFDTIRQVYQGHGYQPIETPAMENLETLMGKYGEEGDRLIFKILNSGNYLEGLPDDLSFTTYPLAQLTKHISEKALRYDLTVPFARYVVQHRNDITFPFKRYQIQPVWRADRPQKGRYREFYQCDADVIGSDSLLNEVELIQIIDEVFTKLGVPVIIKINNRKILQGIAEYIGKPDRMIDIATALDKLDKIGTEGVRDELRQKGFSKEQIEKLEGLILSQNDYSKSGHSQVALLRIQRENFINTNSEVIKLGADELHYIKSMFNSLHPPMYSKIQVDPSLARGLNYYTGTIIEVKVDNTKSASQFTSSICGGGRYDDLTGIFGLPNVSGVGISFGADRIYDVMEELKLFPPQFITSTKVLFINFGEEAKHCFPLLKELRKAGINSELYPDAAKIKKQMDYANGKQIAYVAFLGAEEVKKGIVKLKNMVTGEEKEVATGDLIQHIQ